MEKENLTRLSTYLTVFCASLIVIAKLYGWWITSSVTMLASLLDSVLDICFSIMNLIAVHFALQPPDHEHRFGHGKAEDIAVFVQSSFFGFSGLFIIFNAIIQLFQPEINIEKSSSAGINILLLSIFITGIMVIFQKYIIRRTGSHVLEADSLHYMTDFITNLAAIIGIYFASKYNLTFIDSLTAIAIAFYIIYNAIKMFRRSFNNLMDRELDEDKRQAIIEIIKANDKIIGFHDFKTRCSGSMIFIQFHLEFKRQISLVEAHRIETEIAEKILHKFPSAELIIHLDPEGEDENIMYVD